MINKYFKRELKNICNNEIKNFKFLIDFDKLDLLESRNYIDKIMFEFCLILGKVDKEIFYKLEKRDKIKE